MPLPVQLEVELVDARTARARWAGGVLKVRVPQSWPQAEREAALTRFQRWAEGRLRQDQAQNLAWRALQEADAGRRWSPSSLEAYVRELNAATLKAPLKAVRLGQARLSRLAQCNPRTQVLTFSKHAVDGLPMPALRYLVLHELAHLFEANHSARFWALVAKHEPQWRTLRAVAQHHHAMAVAHHDRQKEAVDMASQPQNRIPYGQLRPAPLGQFKGIGELAPSTPVSPTMQRENQVGFEASPGLAKPKAWGGHPFDGLYRFVPRPYAMGSCTAPAAGTKGPATAADAPAGWPT